MSLKSKAWIYFDRATDLQKAKCSLCSATIGTKGGSTKGLITHLRSKHAIDPNKEIPVEEEAGGAPTTSSASINTTDRHSEQATTKRRRMTDYFSPRTTSSEVILSRMAAKDGIPFHLFITSKDLRAALCSYGVDVPASANTVKSRVLQFAATIQQKYSEDLKLRLERGERFALTLDEWTGLNNKRYMNINVHMTDHTILNLGLVRIPGSMTAERIVETVSTHIGIFGLKMNDDIICCTTDGAAVMKKFGQSISCEHQLCYAHGVHLAVCDVLYSTPTACEEEDEDEEDEEDVDTNFLLDFDLPKASSLALDISEVVKMVRKLVTYFRRSPVRNDYLQKFVKEDCGKEMMLISDNKTRWNSLLAMLERFFLLNKSIQKTLVCQEVDVPFGQREMELINNIVQALKPFELAVRTLSRRDCNLCMAETAVQFAVDELQKQENPLARRLCKALLVRIQERRGNVLIAMSILSNGGKANNNSEFNAAKYVLIGLANKLNLHEKSVEQLQENAHSSNSSEKVITMEERLHLAIMKQQEQQQSKSSAQSKSLEHTIGRELEFLRATGQRGKLLDLLFDALMAIPATSVEAERAFSASGVFLSKVRSRLSDETLSQLLFLRAYFSTSSNHPPGH
jgi:hypothetical protein